MPNEDIDVSNLDRLEKYRSFDRYRRQAEQEARAPHWWRTYREHFGEKSGAGRPERGLWVPASGRRGGPPASFPSFGEDLAFVSLRTVGSVVPHDFSHLLSPLLGRFPSPTIRVLPYIFLLLKLFLDYLPPRRSELERPSALMKYSVPSLGHNCTLNLLLAFLLVVSSLGTGILPVLTIIGSLHPYSAQHVGVQYFAE